MKPCRGEAFAFYVVGYTKIVLRECFALNLGNHAIAWKGESVAIAWKGEANGREKFWFLLLSYRPNASPLQHPGTYG
jgi:hypothetical protein